MIVLLCLESMVSPARKSMGKGNASKQTVMITKQRMVRTNGKYNPDRPFSIVDYV